MRWLDLVKRDPVPWLLDPANPSARLLTLRYLFKKPAASLEKEYARLLAWSPLKDLRGHWNRVNFWGREGAPYFGGTLGNFGTLYLLSQLGVPLFPEIGPACENLLNKGRRSGERFSPEKAIATPWLCYTGMALQIMWHFGYGNDLRTRSTWTALVQTILLRPELLECPIAGGQCYHGVVKALLGLLSAPPHRRTDDDEAASRLRDIRQFGGREGWGTNYKLTKVQAAGGLVQLDRLDSLVAARRRLAAQRDKLLAGLPELALPTTVEGGLHTYYLYTLVVQPSWAGEKRDRLMELLREAYGIQTVIANPPVHQAIPFLKQHSKGTSLPVSEELGKRLFCLPIHPSMTEEENTYLCAALWEAAEHLRRE